MVSRQAAFDTNTLLLRTRMRMRMRIWTRLRQVVSKALWRSLGVCAAVRGECECVEVVLSGRVSLWSFMKASSFTYLDCWQLFCAVHQVRCDCFASICAHELVHAPRLSRHQAAADQAFQSLVTIARDTLCDGIAIAVSCGYTAAVKC